MSKYLPAIHPGLAWRQKLRELASRLSIGCAEAEKPTKMGTGAPFGVTSLLVYDNKGKLLRKVEMTQ